MSPTDLYPSRTGGEAHVLPRKDPVVHTGEGGASADPLTRDQLASYERNGFLRLDALLEPREIERLVTVARNLFTAGPDDASPTRVREPDRDELRSIFEVHREVDTFRVLVRDPRILSIAQQILGGPVYVHQSRINFKPAFRGQPFHWHSDFETWHVEDGMPRMRALSLSLSLTPNRADNGPLMLMPGSHLEYVSCPGTTPENNYERSLRRQEAGVPPDAVLETMARKHGIESPIGDVGSAVLFDCNTMHGSNGNITPFPRSNVFIVFNSVENALVAPFSGQPPRPPHIAARNPEPLA